MSVDMSTSSSSNQEAREDRLLASIDSSGGTSLFHCDNVPRLQPQHGVGGQVSGCLVVTISIHLDVIILVQPQVTVILRDVDVYGEEVVAIHWSGECAAAAVVGASGVGDDRGEADDGTIGGRDV